MNKNHIFLIFLAFLLVFSVFSSRVVFHDVPEYITVAKAMSGVGNLNVFSAHSVIYSFIISLFLRIIPSLITIKLINILWLALIGGVLLYWLKNKWAFLIFAFSPLTWYVGIQTSPILPASFFLLLSYVFFKREDIKFNRAYSGLFLGLTFAIYTPMILVSLFFILIYFWRERVYNLLIFLTAFAIGVLPRIILDYFYFGNPLFSFIKYGGANLVVLLGLHSETNSLQFLNNLGIFLIFFVISPLLLVGLWRLFKTKLKHYQKEIVFLLVVSLILFVRGGLLKYFIIISPIIILLLSKSLTRREIKLHCILSIILIVIMTFTFFGTTTDSLIKADMKNILSDFKIDFKVEFE